MARIGHLMLMQVIVCLSLFLGLGEAAIGVHSATTVEFAAAADPCEASEDFLDSSGTRSHDHRAALAIGWIPDHEIRPPADSDPPGNSNGSSATAFAGREDADPVDPSSIRLPDSRRGHFARCGSLSSFATSVPPPASA